MGIECRTFWVYFVDYDCARRILQEALDGLADAAQVQKGASPSSCPGGNQRANDMKKVQRICFV